MRTLTLSMISLVLVFAACRGGGRQFTVQGNYSSGDSIHNSLNSLDWTGVYRGILPCANCEGIQTEVILNQDFTGVISSKYIGKSDSVFNEEVTFVWNNEGSNISFLNGQVAMENQQYKVGENVLIKLDIQGNLIAGELAPNYRLEKADVTLLNTYWRLVKLNETDVFVSRSRGKEAYITFAEDNRVSGNGGCNTFFGGFELLSENKLNISKIASTKMACIGVETEHLFFGLLESVQEYKILNDTLYLKDGNSQLRAKFIYDFFK